MPSWNDSQANLSDREAALRTDLAGSASLPGGGSTGQVLAKNSGVAGDAGWTATPALTGTTTVYYVDKANGNDANSGHSPWTAKKTIGAAIGNYRTVHVSGGVFSETVDIGGMTGLVLLGSSFATDSLSTGTLVVAPSLSTSALQATTSAALCEIANMSFIGTTSNASAYTGTVFDGTNIGSGCKIRNISIVGIKGDFTGAKTAIGPGINGGVGLLLDNCEQAAYDNVSISNCNKLIYVPRTNTYSKVELSNFHLNQGFISYQEDSGGTTGGDNFYRNWKTQNVFGLTFALGQLASNGSNPADGDTVLVRDQTYRFKNTMALANDVKIGANIDATLLSLVKAVNQTGVVGTDYFTGTVAPTGVQAGWCNLVDYGASGGNGFTLGAVDTTRHACTFQITDTLGPAGNAFTFTVTSTNLSDYFGNGKFSRAAWATEVYESNVWDHIDVMENVSLPAGNAMLVAGNGIEFRGLITAPQTQVSVTGSYNLFQMPTFHQAITVQSGANGNRFVQPYSADRKPGVFPSTSQIVDNGAGTIFDFDATPVALTYGATVATDLHKGSVFSITPNNGTAFTISAPTNTTLSKTIEYTIINTTGGALGALTWNAVFKLATWTQPATGFCRAIRFRWDGTSWREIARTPADVPN